MYKKYIFTLTFALSLFFATSPIILAVADDTFGGLLNTDSGQLNIDPSQYEAEYKGAALSRSTTIQGGFGAVTAFILSFLGFAAIAFVMYGGFIYITANGEQAKFDKAKKIIWESIVAMLIIFGVYAIVNTALDVGTAVNTNFRMPIGPVELQSGPGGGTLQIPL